MLQIFGESPTYTGQRREIGDFIFCSVMAKVRTPHWRMLPSCKGAKRLTKEGKKSTKINILTSLWHNHLQAKFIRTSEKFELEIPYHGKETNRQADLVYNNSINVELQNSKLSNLKERISDCVLNFDNTHWVFNTSFLEDAAHYYLDEDKEWSELDWTYIYKAGLPSELILRYNICPTWIGAVSEPFTQTFTPSPRKSEEQIRKDTKKWIIEEATNVKNGGYSTYVSNHKDKWYYDGEEIGSKNFIENFKDLCHYKYNNKYNQPVYNLPGAAWVHNNNIAEKTDFWFHTYPLDKHLFDENDVRKVDVNYDEGFYHLEYIYNYSEAKNIVPNTKQYYEAGYTFKFKRYTFDEMVKQILDAKSSKPQNIS